MTIIEPGRIIFSNETPQQCDGCGSIDELRPYGPNGSMICFDCGMKDPAGTQARFIALIDKAEANES